MFAAPPLAEVVLRDPLVLSVVGVTSQLTLAIALTIALAGARRTLGFRGTPWWVIAQGGLVVALLAVLVRNAIGPVPDPQSMNLTLRLLGGAYAAGKLTFFASLALGTAERLGVTVSRRGQGAVPATIALAAIAVALCTPQLGGVYLAQGAVGFVAMATCAWRLHRAPAALRTRGTAWLAAALGFYALLSLPYLLGLRYRGTPAAGDTWAIVGYVVDRSSIVDLLGQLLLGLAMLALLLEQQREVARRERANASALEREGATTARLEAIGRVAATVAHELNNPLTVVVATAESLATAPLDPALRRDLALIVREAMRCRHVARDLLLATREESPPHTEVATATIVRHAADAVRLQASAAGVQLRVGVRSRVHVVGDQVALEQAVINLLRNAIDATPRGRTVVVRTDVEEDDAVLVVEDEGSGIAPAVRASLFEPLRTTKAAGRGTGLGLSIVRGIVQRHGGTIDVASQPERALGSSFRIRLPRVAEMTLVTGETTLAPAGDDAGDAMRPASARSATRPSLVLPLPTIALPSPPSVTPVHVPVGALPPIALIIDDEAGIRGILGRTLSRYGYEVAEAGDGLEGQLALTDASRGRLDVIFCDVRMPRLDGVQLLGWMGDACPELLARTVLLTGDTVSDEVRAAVARTGCHVLAKPFARRDLEHTLARVHAPAA
jgi:two-component system NtrC family sensor kinase